MLNDRERQEFQEDALCFERREGFRLARNESAGSVSSMDAYLKFLQEIQKVFSLVAGSRQKTVTKLNKL